MTSNPIAADGITDSHILRAGPACPPGYRVRPLFAAFVLAAWGLTVPSLASSQDSHYWTYQYGTRANLLGGLVIGSVEDISAVYYNPGVLALIPEPELLLTSKVFELIDYSAQGWEDRSLELNDLRADQAPGFFGGTMPFKFLENHVLAYSVFTRYRQKLRMDAINVWHRELFGTFPGNEDAFSQLLLSRDLSETWVGLSWSAPLGKFGLGVSQFLAYRSQRSTRLAGGSIHSAAVPAASASNAETAFSYWNARLLWKLGLSWEWEGVSWGLTATTPGLSLLGQGRALVYLSAAGQDTVGDVRDPVFVAAYQEGLDANYQSPWSLGLGAAYGFGKSRVHFSAEYFSKNREFVIMDGGRFVGQSTGDTLSLTLTDQQNDVINFGVGFRHELNGQVTGYASFRTDFSSVDREHAEVSVSAPLNLYFVTAGTALRIPIADITLGLGYGWGKSTLPVRVRDTLEDDFITDQLPETVTMLFRSLRLIFAFSI
ncbi:MAG: hypothetical protein JSW71_11935 [Gemmatimonadota bacterium]|nr:MAG: hypothetical protein JSW71_11935 [Gemmatimonadota bacterium]